MALTKKTYKDGETVITAENMNAIQDEVIRLDSAKAPDGYGLGGGAQEPLVGDLNNATQCGWYAFTANTANRPFDYGSVMVTNRYGNQVTQLAFNPHMAGVGEMCVRHYYDGKWHDWEYVNPPMKLGVEYRTAERWSGKVVYTKLVNCGTMPNSANVNINCIDKSWTIIDFEMLFLSSYMSIKLPHFDSTGKMTARVLCNTSSSVFQILTTADMSECTGYLTIKYTKD